MVIAAEPMDAQRAYEVCCLHCGATDPEVIDVRRLPPVHDSLRDREH
jgi:hypothetical protein